MAKIRAFRGLRYSSMLNLNDCICPPYDIISEKEREELYERCEYNIIRIEYGKEYENDNEVSNKFTRAKSFLNDWIKRGILQYDQKESFYIIEQSFTVGERSYTRTGIIATLELVDFSKGIVIPHEFTLSKPKQERLNLLRHTKANISSIYGLYEDGDYKIKDVIDKIKLKKEVVSYEGIGTSEKLWIVDDADLIDKIARLFESKKIFIADGHHRYETALEYKKEMISQKGCNNDADYNYVLITLTALEDEGIVILPTHRIVLDCDIGEDEIIAKLGEKFYVEKGEFDKLKQMLKKEKKYAFLMYTYNNNFYFLKLMDVEKNTQSIIGSTAYKNLDVVILQELIFNDILNIGKDAILNQVNLKYTKSEDELIDSVKSGAKYGFILNPTLVSELKDVSLSGEKMPQKSTYFYPKLMTGNVLFVHKD